MASYDAARRGAKRSVMHRVMTGDASYESTLKTALGVGWRHCRQSQNCRVGGFEWSDLGLAKRPISSSARLLDNSVDPEAVPSANVDARRDQ
jgi:hypothetical protein